MTIRTSIDPAGQPLRIAVIGGGANGEHDVSLASAAAAAAALEGRGHTCIRLTIGVKGDWSVNGEPTDLGAVLLELGGCDVALPLVHGPRGEDGSLAALCEFAGVPWVGSGVIAGAVGMDKWAAKQVAASVGVAVAPAVLLTDPGADPGPWRGPVVVKPVAAGSSLGVQLVTDPARLSAAVSAAAVHGDRILVEQAITGREIDIAVLAGDGTVTVSAPLEIVTAGWFDYEAKYGHGARFIVPAQLDAARLDQLVSAATRIFGAIGCAGVARVDFFLTAQGWVFNEINTVPGMTPASQVPLMFTTGGLDYPLLMDRLVREAIAVTASGCDPRDPRGPRRQP